MIRRRGDQGAHLPKPLATAPQSSRPEPRSYFLRAVMVAVILLPAIRLARLVLAGPSLQFADYWLMLPEFTTSDGGLDVGGLLLFNNEHPMIVPKALYWVNLQLFSGSNRSLGLIDIGIVLAQLAILWKMCTRGPFSPTVRVVVAASTSALLLSRVGAWNFTFSMSGTAWLTANLFAIGAVHLRSIDRPRHAFAVAILAAISYGTGIAAWPAVVVTGVGRRGIRSAWREWPFVLALGVTYIWYQVGSRAATQPSVDLRALPRSMAQVLGLVFDLGGGTTPTMGFFALVAIPVLVLVSQGSSQRLAASSWAGIATYGYLACAVIAAGRSDTIAGIGVQNRYYSLPAIAWIGLFVLLIIAVDAVLAARRRTAEIPWLPVVVTSVLGGALLVAVVPGGGSQEDEMLESWKPRQQLAEVAFRLGLIDGSYYLTVYQPVSEITPLMAAVDHYPFVDDWGLDCGLLGDRISEAGPGEQRMAGGLESGDEVFGIPGAIRLEGSIPRDRNVRCVLIADQRDVVVGAGTVLRGSVEGDPASPSSRRIRALARRGAESYSLFVVLDGTDLPHRVGDAMDATAIAPASPQQ